MPYTPTTGDRSSWGPRDLDKIVIAILVAIAVFASAWFGIELTRGTGRIAAIWIANGVLLAAVLKHERRDWPLFIVLAYAANILANLQTGDELAIAAMLSACNSLEVLVCAFFVTTLTSQRDFRRPKPMFMLVLSALGPASVAAAGVASYMLSQLAGTDFVEVFINWYAADALGLVTVTPVLLVIGRRDLLDLLHPTVLPRLAFVLAVVAVALAAIFLQSSMPLLFLAIPAVVAATFALGFTGASLAVLLTAVVALVATLHNVGPISLMDADLRMQIHALQLFTATAALTATAVACLLGERDLLSAALAQAPDFYYIKNLKSEFVSVNQRVAEVAGFERPSQLVGKTDRDLVPPERAEMLLREEYEVMVGGSPMQAREERVVDADETERWFETSKVALKSLTGRTIGLAGMTRDITARKKLQAELIESRNQMALIMREMSDGLMVVSPDGYIVYCNERYQQLFPLTGDLRVPGAYLPTVLAAAQESGEQTQVGPADIMRSLKSSSEHEVRLFNGTWLHMRTSVNALGVATVLVSNITSAKRTETELRAAGAQLAVLAATDGLTSLPNRRALDERLDKEIARCRRNRLPVSLIMIDIDHFKTFNDRYGHLAGDKCLQRVAATLENCAKRPGDIVARFGGEEFCVVLPETDEAGAFVLAEQLRLAVRELQLEHDRSDKSVVTISLGVASLVHDGKASTAEELISRADEALYVAKGAGRDRVMGWSARVENRFSSTG